MSYHAFFSHSNSYKSSVEQVAIYIEDKYHLKVWLDKWNLIPGNKWIQEIQKTLNEVNSCVVFLGKENSTGWYENEIELALNIESKNRDKYRIIPVLLPKADDLSEGSFLSTRTAIDLRDNIEDEEQLHRLKCGIMGVSPGRWENTKNNFDKTEEKLKQLRNYRDNDLIVQEVYIDFQSKILEKEFGL